MTQHSYLLDSASDGVAAHSLSFDAFSEGVEGVLNGDVRESARLAEAALVLARMGYRVFPCRPCAGSGGRKAKSPLIEGGFKSATNDEGTIRDWWSRWSDALIGLATGVEAGLLVLDLDTRNGIDGRTSLAALEAEFGALPPTQRVKTPSGGEHLYFRMPKGSVLKCSASKLGPGIDVRGEGGYVIAPPSRLIDDSGACLGEYEPIAGPSRPAEAPEWLVRLIERPPRSANLVDPASSAEASAPVASGASMKLELLAETVSEAKPGKRNTTLNGAAFSAGQILAMGLLHRGAAEEALWRAAQACGLGEAEARATIESGIESGLANPPRRPLFVDVGSRGGTDTRSWRNVEAFLDWLGVTVRRNEFTNRDEIEGLPGHPLLVDDALLALWDRAHKVDFRVGKTFLGERLQARALEGRYHPVRDRLDSLEWDGKPRLDTWLPDYTGAEDNEYTRAVGAKTLIAAVRRLRRPGTKFDQLLILEGAQGTGKSSALRILAMRDDWFTDCLSLTHDSKVIIEQTEGKLIVEVPELKGMRRGDIEHVKAMLSRARDRARKAYAHFADEVPRQFILIGTTNTDKDGTCWYLKDPTGNRRFWPMRTGNIDLDALEKDRDQLWAEAAVREAAGESIELPAQLWRVADHEQQARTERDPWVENIQDVLGDLEGKIRTTEARRIVSKWPGRWDAYHDQRFGRAMREAGWENRELRLNGRKARFYVKGPPPWRQITTFESDGQCEARFDSSSKAEDQEPGNA